MSALSKLCDAADWFDPAFDHVVRHELEEMPRLHRKQWEFAQIFRALKDRGALSRHSRGLSMGGGRERLLYAVARRAGHLTVTDLYEPGSAWHGARTDDPDRMLKASAPFAIDPARLTATSMDMRSLDFPDRTFDFCYSSCAIEHIGNRDDFLRHLGEVGRVLKDDGIYVLTTEFHYGEAVVSVPHNYYFSAPYLGDLIADARFRVADEVDGHIQPHALNRPLPARMRDLCADPSEPLANLLLDSAPHVQLLAGGLPFTSLCLVLASARVTRSALTGGPLPMAGLDASRQFIGDGVRAWRSFVESTGLALDPFGLFADRRPEHRVPRLVRVGDDDTVFHSGYVWLGSGARTVHADLDVWPTDAGPASLEVRAHRAPTSQPDQVTSCATTTRPVQARERVQLSLSITPDEAGTFAILAKVTAGACWIGDVAVRVDPA